ncbi:MAG: diguanylate cyclase domain-containing protein [Candidatus Nanopelagicaceae bacterium]
MLSVGWNYSNLYPYLYIAICAALIFANYLARQRNGPLFLIALIAWSTSELASQIFDSTWASVGYVLFYPIAFLAIPALFEINQKSELIRLIDGAILVLGTSAIATTLLLRKIHSDFLHILYPICDLILLIAVFIAFARRPITIRSLLMLSGFLIYLITDFLYLQAISTNSYEYESILNLGWLFGFALISIALFRRGIKSEKFPPIPIFYIAISTVSSALILVAVAMDSSLVPIPAIAPASATLFTSFLRMAIALKQSERNIAEESLARIDDLTGLPNRRRFIAEVDKYRDGSILLLDLDGFKPVNDQFGHEVGDEILKQASARFLKTLPDDSLLARLGGDEFAVLTKANYERAMELSMALRATLSYPFNVGGEQIKIDVSIGCVSNDGRSDLMSRADTAMYQAKRAQVGV